MINVEPYLELEFDHPRFNCWTLCDRILKDLYNTDTGVGNYDGELQKADNRFLLEIEKWVECDSPSSGRVVVFNINGRPLHCGMCISHGEFVHAIRGGAVVIENLNHPMWRKRIKGFYEWQSLSHDRTS